MLGKVLGAAGVRRAVMAGLVLATLVGLICAAASQTHAAPVAETGADMHEDEDHGAPAAQAGDSGLTLSVAQQTTAGIQTTSLRATRFRARLSVLAEVVDLSPLLELRSGLETVRARRDESAASFAAAREEYERKRRLRADGASVSARAMQSAEARWRGAKALLAGQQANLRDIRSRMLLQWGSVLTQWALASDPGPSDVFARLSVGEEVLLRAVLPADRTLPDGAKVLHITSAFGGAPAEQAVLVSPAPAADEQIPGATYFFRAPRGNLRTGQRLDAWLALPEERSGVTVPEQAVVWYAGQSWVYRQVDNTHFVRCAVATDLRSGDGWFVSGGVEPGQRIVVTGAQLLLSEEFRAAPAGEDD